MSARVEYSKAELDWQESGRNAVELRDTAEALLDGLNAPLGSDQDTLAKAQVYATLALAAEVSLVRWQLAFRP